MHTSNFYPIVKRLLDIFFAIFALLLLAPFGLIVALWVAFRDGRPVFFLQRRIGLHGHPFTIVKFRTMSIDSSDPDDENARLSFSGKILREWSIDEIPSLWNILIGEMSFVGPRPLLEEYMSFYTREHSRRHEVRPGLTGLSQVSGRNHLGWMERLDLDVQYVDSFSALGDVSILLRTIRAVILRVGVNQSDGRTMSKLGPGYASTRELNS